MTKVNAIKCPVCKDTIFSRANHDFRRCTCGNCFIDGGLSQYYRVGFEKEAPQHVDLEVPQTAKELYNDWNTSADKYGLISSS